MTPDQLGLEVVHRRYVPYSAAHYAGHLVDGAYALGLFGDVATELCILTDADEGLLAGYHDVRFLAPVQAGDVLEVRCVLESAGRRSRRLAFVAEVVARGTDDVRPSRALPLDPPLVVTTAVGTVVVPSGGSDAG